MAFEYGQTEITKREYNLYIALSGGTIIGLSNGTISDTQAVKIGVLADQPKITTEKGEDVPLNTGAKKVISENINFEAVLYEVTSENYTELRKLIESPCDIFLTDDDAVTPSNLNNDTATTSGKQVISIRNMIAFPALEIVGNAQNKVNLSAELEAGVGSANVTIAEG